MNHLQIFQYAGQEIHTIKENDEPLFLLKDICRILSLGNPRQVKTRLEKGVISNYPLQTTGGTQRATFINEDGLYDVILDSRKAEAKQFRKWITSEVIPAIRKHGGYLTPEKTEEALLNPDTIIKLATNLKEEQAKRKQVEQELLDMQPKALYYESILKNPGLVTVTQIAKDYGMSAIQMNKLLHHHGIQYRKSGQWLLYRKYDAKGYVHSETIAFTRSDGRPDVSMTTKWTQKGRLFLYQVLKENGIVPMIEQEQFYAIN